MPNQFKITNSSDLKNLQRFYRLAPAKFGQVMNATLNSLAFTTLSNIKVVLNQKLNIRDPRFMRGSLKVVKARGGNHRSIVGSIERKRFTGWEEQQTGKASDVNRSPTLAARGGNETGNFNRKMSGKSRLKRNAKFLSIRNISVGNLKGRKGSKANQRRRSIILLRQAKKTKRPFIVKRADVGIMRINKRWTPGLYQFKRNKLLRMQTFGKPQDPKRIDWMGIALKRTATGPEFRQIFAIEFEKMAKNMGVKVR